MPEENKENKRINISVVEEQAEIPNDSNPVSPKKPNIDIKELPKEIKTDTPDKIPFWVMFVAFVIGLSLGAGLIGGIFYYKSHVDVLNKTIAKETPTPPPSSLPGNEKSPEASPSASPKTNQDLSKITVQILNGSGIKGEASKVEILLKEAGFTNIKTGNAAKYDYQETEISLKKGTDATLFETISKILEGYVITENTTPSPTYDILITIGSKKE